MAAELVDDDLDIWDRFASRLDFRPSVDPREWPSIAEPSPSTTFDVSTVFGPDYESLLRDAHEKVRAAIQTCALPGEWIYSLDWNHATYRSRSDDPDASFCPFANGDYAIVVPGDVRFGLFGHPWEQTVCVFGAALLTALASDPPRMFGRVVRRR